MAWLSQEEFYQEYKDVMPTKAVHEGRNDNGHNPNYIGGLPVTLDMMIELSYKIKVKNSLRQMLADVYPEGIFGLSFTPGYFSQCFVGEHLKGLRLLPASEAAFHQFTAKDPKRPNLKFIDDLGNEWVFTYEGTLIRDGADAGSFNFGSQPVSPDHFHKDILPWICWGNGPTDKTSFEQRYALALTTLLGWVVKGREADIPPKYRIDVSKLVDEDKYNERGLVPPGKYYPGSMIRRTSSGGMSW